MKKVLVIISISICCILQLQLAAAQTAEVTQLLLDVQKLAQLKSILSDMKSGYDIISTGYNTIKGISEGSFNLHDAFLNGLLIVNPKLRKYQRVADIIQDQAEILKKYKSDFKSFKASGTFNPEEIAYLTQVYNNLFDQSLQNLDELTMVLIDSKLRMGDDERLSAIDHIYKDMQDKLSFLRSFDQKPAILEQQRQAAQRETEDLQQIYDSK